ncbi:HD domain-containing protein, partial [bacterium]
PYIVHPAYVATFGYRHFDLFSGLDREAERVETAACALWLHDVMEDCAWTYNDFKERFGESVAEAVYYVSDHKGKTRAERQERTYQEMAGRLEPTFVKLCDRYINMWWSLTTGGRLGSTYATEWEHFQGVLRVGAPADRFSALWDANAALVAQATA